MFRWWMSRRGRAERAEKFRQEHELWLTAALTGSGRVRTRRIPIRRVSEGGFSRMTGTPEGRYWIEQWWNGTFSDRA